MPDIHKAVIYAAKSTTDKHRSIPGQLADCRKMAEQQCWEVVGEFHDENFSAYSGDRGPELAAALALADERAEESGEIVAFVVQHSDRISRGAGDKPDAPKALIEIWHGQRRLNVHLKSWQDDEDLRSSSSVANLGERNHMDSKRKGAAVKDGLGRTVAEDKHWRGGILPGGYEATHALDERGAVTRRVVKHSEDEWIYDLIFRLAEGGDSGQKISLELGRRGALTRPVRKKMEHKKGPKAGTVVEYKPRPFTANRVSQVLCCPFYAGFQLPNGERFEGDWPNYVDIETFERLKGQRLDRAGDDGTKRPRGRPPEGYLLSNLAVCALCGGPMQGCRDRSRNKGARSYACAAHREYHKYSDDWCRGTAFDAVDVDRKVLLNLKKLLNDATAMREQLLAGKRAELAKLGKIAASAQTKCEAAKRAADLAMEELAGEIDPEVRAVLKDNAVMKRREAANEADRANAALDALRFSEEEPAPDQARVMQDTWDSLSGAIKDAGGNVKLLNVVLRESFDRFELGEGPTIALVFSAAGLARTGYDAPAPAPRITGEYGLLRFS